MSIKIIVLGSGTSTGVPILGKHTPVNHSKDPKDTRLRASLFIDGKLPIIIDTGPDFRLQLLNNQIDDVSHVLLTHSHYDHVGGLDDLRPLCFKNDKGITCFSDDFTHREIIGRYQYFYREEDYFGKPKINFNLLPENENGLFASFYVGETLIQPVKLMHIKNKSFHSIGYVFDKKFAYLTDFREVFTEYTDFLYDLDLMIIGAPLPKPHPNHLSIFEAVDLINKYRAKKGAITHLADGKFHKELENELPQHIRPAYDGMELSI
ncbi:MAG: MBL fold metallo-hydrolase [Spirochaetia bacterium]|nr:MBL fold metallo-hydrolase [Spirochaetia bacterium]